MKLVRVEENPKENPDLPMKVIANITDILVRPAVLELIRAQAENDGIVKLH